MNDHWGALADPANRADDALPGGSGTADGTGVEPVAGRAELDDLIGPLLRALAEIGGFAATYVTAIDWGLGIQNVPYVHNTGPEGVPLGVQIDCPPGMAQQAFLGVTRSNDATPPQPDSAVARSLGFATYASVPILTADHRIYGTLCGASRGDRQVSDDTISVMEFFARLIADHMARGEARRKGRRAARAEAQLRERAMFLAEAEHMLKTPLTVILACADMLNGTGTALPEADRIIAIGALTRNAALLASQIDLMLEEAVADVRSRDPHLVNLEVLKAVRTTVEDFNGSTHGHPLRVHEGPEIWAQADPGLLAQILGHLLDNAVKYSASGAPIDLAVRGAGSWVEIDVKDQGIGLPVGVDVFAAFQRGPVRPAQDHPGVGLGLHIVRSLSRALGGAVTARPNTGAGSTFTVRLPRVESGRSAGALADRDPP